MLCTPGLVRRALAPELFAYNKSVNFHVIPLLELTQANQATIHVASGTITFRHEPVPLVPSSVPRNSSAISIPGPVPPSQPSTSGLDIESKGSETQQAPNMEDQPSHIGDIEGSPEVMDWGSDLIVDPDYEIDSDGHWTPRAPERDWTKAQMEAAEAAYQKTLEGMDPCEVCASRKTYCYQCDNYRCHSCAQNKCPECSRNRLFELHRLGLL